MTRRDLSSMTPDEKLADIPGWIGAILESALANAAAANGGEVPEEAVRRAAKVAAAFGVVPRADDGDKG